MNLSYKELQLVLGFYKIQCGDNNKYNLKVLLFSFIVIIVLINHKTTACVLTSKLIQPLGSGSWFQSILVSQYRHRR